MTASSPTRSVYFYPRPPRGGRPRSSTCRPRAESISIHALREEGDLVPPCVPQIVHGISIHALREEGDYTRSASTAGVRAFLSTPSARRATDHRQHSAVGRQISIHALREEGDGHGPRWWTASRNFYPRPPRGGRHAPLPEKEDDNAFLSTPSARRATDLVTGMASGMKHFYPRPPRGGRPGEQTFVHVLESFLSTPSARRAT